MSNMQELYQAMGMFTEGVQALAVTNGVNAASQQINDINNSQMDELEKRKAQQAVSQQLALRLTGAGASSDHVAQAVGAVAPKAINSGSDMYSQGVQKNDEKMIGLGTKMMDQEAKAGQELQKTKNVGDANVATIKGEYGLKEAAVKGSKAQSESQFKFSKAFDAATKPLVEGLDAIDSMQALSGMKNGVADMAVRSNLARTIGSEKGRIAVQEISQYTGSQSLANQFMRAIGKAANGQVLTEKDRSLIDETVQTSKVAKEAALKDKIMQHSERATLEGAFPDSQAAIKAFVGGSPRLQQIAGIAQAKAAGAASADAQGGAPQAALPSSAPRTAVRTEVRMSTKTGKATKVYVDRAGNPVGVAE